MERTETQRKILEVGKKEFLEKGFKDASLNKIVAEAGFTKVDAVSSATFTSDAIREAVRDCLAQAALR